MTEKPTMLFDAIERARPLLIEAFDHLGVEQIEYVVGFSAPFRVVVWLATATDEERDAIGVTNPRLEEIEMILDIAKVPRAVMSDVLSTVQSQETVDRDYMGSWFYALR